VTKTVSIKNNIPKVIDGLSTSQQKKLLNSIGVRFEGKLVEGIQHGRGEWAPLSQEWAEFKGHGKQWYHTAATEGAIKFKVEGDHVRSGWVDGGELADRAMRLEYGTSKIPARPLLRPVFEENKDDVRKDAIDWIKDAVKKGKI